ncbi:hypothetical protein PsYK624_009000 [Phanerochaete sordida]|uniref:Uncharacterized protein n=1 Tax=Phanerochaete sordida TaxID=48140 RepID=A0A9P3FYV4_9APHY|nr:hypothetical protein PsYK624_009000 [Phanerochaete sordida]
MDEDVDMHPVTYRTPRCGFSRRWQRYHTGIWLQIATPDLRVWQQPLSCRSNLLRLPSYSRRYRTKARSHQPLF